MGKDGQEANAMRACITVSLGEQLAAASVPLVTQSTHPSQPSGRSSRSRSARRVEDEPSRAVSSVAPPPSGAASSGEGAAKRKDYDPEADPSSPGDFDEETELDKMLDAAM